MMQYRTPQRRKIKLSSTQDLIPNNVDGIPNNPRLYSQQPKMELPTTRDGTPNDARSSSQRRMIELSTTQDLTPNNSRWNSQQQRKMELLTNARSNSYQRKIELSTTPGEIELPTIDLGILFIEKVPFFVLIVVSTAESNTLL